MNFFSNCRAVILCAALVLTLFPGCHQMEQSYVSLSSPEASISSSEPEEIRPPDFPVQVFDMELQQRPERVVSLSPALTELLCAFGFEDRLYGVSDYCNYPDSVKGITSCGSPLSPDLAEIQDLVPDLLVTLTPLQQNDYQALQDMGIQIVEITAPADLEELFGLYYDICLLMDGVSSGGDAGLLFSQGYKQQLTALEEKVSNESSAGILSAVWIIESDTPILVEGGTLYHEILSVLGLKNLAENGLSEDTVPDLVLYGDTVKVEDLTASAQFGTWEAVNRNQIVEVPLAPLERYSPRMFDLLETLADQIYTMNPAESE